MIVQGKNNEAKIFTDKVDETALYQIEEMLDQTFVRGETIRIMPDVHAGKGSTIGTTMTIKNGKVVPNLVGVDIGCGISVCQLGNVVPNDWEKLNQTIQTHIPSGFSIRNEKAQEPFDLRNLSFHVKNAERIQCSKGTLGGGNHFIEVSEMNGNYYLLIHSGSRNLGVQVASTHQNKAIAYHRQHVFDTKQLVLQLKKEGREKDIQSELMKRKTSAFPKALAYLENDLLAAYLNDMEIAQRFALENRKLMTEMIVKHMNWQIVDYFDSIHNYIDIENHILRKGATDASKDKRLVIPLNMRDGSIIAKGKGNPDWNFSAPHGAGRVMSRKKAKETLNLAAFQETMTGVYSTSVVAATLDEAPFAYKEAQEIIRHIEDTVSIIGIAKPVYNFKAH